MRAISALTALSLMGCVIAPAPPPDGSAFGDRRSGWTTPSNGATAGLRFVEPDEPCPHPTTLPHTYIMVSSFIFFLSHHF